MAFVNQVITILCFVLIPRITESVKRKAINEEELSQIPGSDILSGVNIWKDNQITSIGKMFGPRIINEGRVESGDLNIITDMSFTAMGCLFSENIINLLLTTEAKIEKCQTNTSSLVRVSDNAKFLRCFKPIIIQWKSLRIGVVKMLTTILNFSEKFGLPVNKHLLNAIMAVHLFINNIDIDKSNYEFSNNPKELNDRFVSDFFTVNLYTQNTIVAFAVFNCSFEEKQFDTINEDYDANTLQELISGLYIPETYFKRDMFDVKNLTLTDVMLAQLNNDENFRNIGVRYHILCPLLGNVYSHLKRNNCPEIITKFQTLAFQSIGSLILYSIRKITDLLTEPGQILNPHTEAVVNGAIDVLERFSFPGFLQATIRKLSYEKLYRPRYYSFVDLEFDYFEVDNVIHPSVKNNMELLTNFLEYFTSQIKSMEIYIKKAIVVNQYLCDYEHEEIGFLQYDYSKIDKYKDNLALVSQDIFKMTPIMQSSKYYNCELSYVAIKHFIFNDYIISQCLDLLLSVKNDLIQCFEIFKKSIKSIGDTFDTSLATIMAPSECKWPCRNAIRKVIDAILAAKLYFNNDDLLGNCKVLQHLMDMDMTHEHGSVNINQVYSKFEILKRSNRFIANLLEQFTVHNCATPLPRSKFTKSISTTINEQCKEFIDNKQNIPIVECVSKLIEENYKNLPIFETNIDRYTILTIENLLMDDIFGKALIRNNSLSMLHNIDVLWEGDWKKLKEIREFVKNNINPKYLYTYQVTIIKAIFFMAYEHIITIVRTSTDNDNLLLYRNNISTMLEALNSLLSVECRKRIIEVYRMILNYLESYLEEGTDANEFVRLIEAEKSSLGIQNELSIDVAIFELEHQRLDSKLETTSEVPDVEMSESYENETNTENVAGQGNINKLMMFMNDVKEIWTSLTNVTRVMYLRDVTDVLIQ